MERGGAGRREEAIPQNPPADEAGDGGNRNGPRKGDPERRLAAALAPSHSGHSLRPRDRALGRRPRVSGGEAAALGGVSRRGGAGQAFELFSVSAPRPRLARLIIIAICNTFRFW